MRQPILAAVTTERLRRLRAIGPGWEFLAADSWSQAYEMIRAYPVAIAVVDPLLGGEVRTVGIERVRQHFPSLPLLIFTALEPGTAGALLDLGRSGIRRAVFSRFDDGPVALRAALTAEVERSAAQQVLQAMAGTLGDLPEPLRAALHELIGSPVAPGALTVTELARRSGVERRTIERIFARAELPSPRTVLMALRLLYAHRLLLDPGHTVEDVTAKLGYGKPKTFQAHCREIFGTTAGELRTAITIDEAMDIVCAGYFPAQRRAAS